MKKKTHETFGLTTWCTKELLVNDSYTIKIQYIVIVKDFFNVGLETHDC